MENNQTKVVHCKVEKYDTYIGRPSKWGNPFTHHKTGTLAEIVVASRDVAVENFRNHILTRLKNEPELLKEFNQEIRHKTLGCWCKPKRCHGDILAEIAQMLDDGVDIFSIDLSSSDTESEENTEPKRYGSSPID